MTTIKKAYERLKAKEVVQRGTSSRATTTRSKPAKYVKPKVTLCDVCREKYAKKCLTCEIIVCHNHGISTGKTSLCRACAATPEMVAAAPREWRVDTWFKEAFTLSEMEPFLVIRAPEFLKVVRYQIQHQNNEDAGLFLVDPEGLEVVWLEQHPEESVSERSGASVVASPGALVTRCLIEKGRVPTGQWHTHPQFNPFWSSTDNAQQKNDVYDAYKMEVRGERHFFVVGYGIGMTLRHYYWDKEAGLAEYRDGYVTLADSTSGETEYTDLKISKPIAAKYRRGITTYHYPAAANKANGSIDMRDNYALDWMLEDEQLLLAAGDSDSPLDPITANDLLTDEEYRAQMESDSYTDEFWRKANEIGDEEWSEMTDDEWMEFLGYTLTGEGKWIKSDTLLAKNGRQQDDG